VVFAHARAREREKENNRNINEEQVDNTLGIPLGEPSCWHILDIPVTYEHTFAHHRDINLG